MEQTKYFCDECKTEFNNCYLDIKFQSKNVYPEIGNRLFLHSGLILFDMILEDGMPNGSKYHFCQPCLKKLL